MPIMERFWSLASDARRLLLSVHTSEVGEGALECDGRYASAATVVGIDGLHRPRQRGWMPERQLVRV